jgi:hypothetical protein
MNQELDGKVAHADPIRISKPTMPLPLTGFTCSLRGGSSKGAVKAQF